MRERTRRWRLREALKVHTPAPLLAAYRRKVVPLLGRNVAHVRFAHWAATGRSLCDEFGTTISFEPDGIWIRDPDGTEWRYEPSSFYSALGKEVAWEHEPAEIEYVISALRPGGTYVDAGAHVGGYAIPVAQNTQDVAIQLFEPVPATRELLEANLVRNRLSDRVHIWPFAVGERAGKSQISVADGVGNRLAGEGRAGPGAIDIEVVSIDDMLLDRAERVDVIKCDVEGNELPALKGAESILRRDRPDLLLEVDRRFTPRFGYTPEDLFGWLGDLGYGWQRFSEDGLLPAADLEEALSAGHDFLFTAR
jgi:FkbM family methyltransferase